MWKNLLWAPICLIILFLFVPDEMTLLIKGLIIIGFVILLFIGWYWVQSFRYRALILKGQAHSSLLQGRVIHNQHGSWIESNKKLELVPLHDNPSLRINGHDRPLTDDERWYRSLTSKVTETKIIQGQSTPILQQELPHRLNLLDEIKKFERILIIGVTDTGKTTLIMKTIENRQGKIIALDPHNEKGKWPHNVKVVGGGRKFELITQALESLTVIMNQRYSQMEKGLTKERAFSPIWVVADEWRAAVQHSKEGAELLKELLNEGRKVNIGMVLGSQSERVRALGIEGEGDLKESFCIVRLKLNLLNKERRATIDFGEGQIECDFILDNTILPAVVTPEQMILQDYQAGVTTTAIAKKIYGPKAGGYQAEKVKKILRNFGYSI